MRLGAGVSERGVLPLWDGLAVGTQNEFGVDNLGITLVFWRIEVLQRNLHACTMRIKTRSNAEIDVP